MESFVPGEANQLVFRLFSGPAGTNPAFKRFIFGEVQAVERPSSDGASPCLPKKGLNALYARAETFTEHTSSPRSAALGMQSFRKSLSPCRRAACRRRSCLCAQGCDTRGILPHLQYSPYLRPPDHPDLNALRPFRRIAPRLVSRFEWGINVRFEKLAGKDLKNVLLKRCTELHFPLADDVAEDLVQIFPSSKSLNRALDAFSAPLPSRWQCYPQKKSSNNR